MSRKTLFLFFSAIISLYIKFSILSLVDIDLINVVIFEETWFCIGLTITLRSRRHTSIVFFCQMTTELQNK